MADGIFPGLVSATRDANTLANPMFVQLSDGTIAGVIPGVGATNLGKAEDAAHVSGDVGVMSLAVRSDADTPFGADGDYVPLATDADGALKVNVITAVSAGNLTDDTAYAVGTDYVNPSGYLADETTPDSVDEGDIGLARMTLDRKQLFVLVDATNDAQRLAISATGNAGVNIAEQTLTAVAISKDANSNAETNPLYVYQVNTVTSGNEIHDYDTAAAVASDSSDNHDYTVAGTTFLLKSVIVSGSGNVKFEIQTGPLATLATVAVGFLTGRQGDTKQIVFDPAVEVPVTSTGTVRIIRTNRQGSATDLYSTIIGSDV
jgi:hypothetical protein